MANMQHYHAINHPNYKVAGVRPVSWGEYKMPEGLGGKTVLDIGARDGGFSFEAERRGAQWVYAIDVIDQPAFWVNREALNSNVQWRTMSVYDLPLDRFDVVFFLQVLYHCRHPLLALERVAAITGELCVFETLVDAESVAQPALIYYPGAECGNDASNWVGPNRRLLEAWFKELGFRHELVYQVGNRVAYHLTK